MAIVAIYLKTKQSRSRSTDRDTPGWVMQTHPQYCSWSSVSRWLSSLYVAMDKFKSWVMVKSFTSVSYKSHHTGLGCMSCGRSWYGGSRCSCHFWQKDMYLWIRLWAMLSPNRSTRVRRKGNTPWLRVLTVFPLRQDSDKYKGKTNTNLLLVT